MFKFNDEDLYVPKACLDSAAAALTLLTHRELLLELSTEYATFIRALRERTPDEAWSYGNALEAVSQICNGFGLDWYVTNEGCSEQQARLLDRCTLLSLGKYVERLEDMPASDTVAYYKALALTDDPAYAMADLLDDWLCNEEA